MASGVWQIPKIPELRNRILIMVALLAVYRFGVFIPTPGTNREALAAFFNAQGGTLFQLYNLFSGGALEQFSIFTLGVMPYISASIIMQLLTVVIPALDRVHKEGEAGRQRITQWTRYSSLVISVIQGLAIAYGLENMASPTGGGESVVLNPGWGFRLMAVLTLATGCAFIMWLGERIQEWGIGNGISIIIMAGIVVRFPDAMIQTVAQMRTGELNFLGLLLLGCFAALVIAFIVYCERGQRRIPVQYAKRVVGRKVYGGQNTHLPLKINMSGVIPPIFASSLIMFPATLASFFRGNQVLADVQNLFAPGTTVYMVSYALLTVFFCYFYTSVTFNPADVAENMQKHGGYIPGIRPGKPTAEFIDRVLSRLTLSGAVYITAVCLLPELLIQEARVNFYFGGTSLLIVVGVALDLVAQIESHLLTQHYDGLMGAGGTQIRGRTRRMG